MNLISLVYNLIAIPMASAAVTFIKPFNKKLREREGMWEEAIEALDDVLPVENQKRIWFHAASMGEFEQAKPIIENIKKTNPEYKIIVSFFSPSGYNNQKNYKYADAIVYMPFDKRGYAKYFINRIKPDLAVFIRYEIWRNHIEILHQKGIPAFLICATKPNKKMLYENFLLRNFTKSNYNFYTKIYTISSEHTEFFKDLGVKSEIITLSDTRFDRIIENVERGKSEKLLPEILFSEKDFILVAGSTWEQDEDIIIQAVRKIEKENITKFRLIIVPHEPTEKHLERLREFLPNSFFLSQIEDLLKNENDSNIISGFLGKNHIIVDSIGKLLRLYSNAHAAFIGGGFGVGVHSVTEPAGYGIPLACGTNMNNSPDAIHLHQLNGLAVIANEDDFYSWLKKVLSNKEFYQKAGLINKEYIYSSLGSSKKVSEDIIKTIESLRH